MSDKFAIVSAKRLLHTIFTEYKSRKQIFGVHKSLFFKPLKEDGFRQERYGQLLHTPLGVAAGPHTQLAQNIITAWLCGARYIELKTIQTLDKLEISKPCIDMQDEGYNCEWSQELRIEESFQEYLKAWVIIHVLSNFFKMDSPGVIFNMSVGYDMQGILKDNIQWFFRKMNNAEEDKLLIINELKELYPAIKDLQIPSRISDNITLSTMHGCPPEEVEEIGLYLIEKQRLNTSIKLNPTLLGAVELRQILNEHNGFFTEVPDIAFEHDLKYADALRIIKNLSESAENQQVAFGLKLTNTLESLNKKTIFKPENEMMYMSGKALHPISVRVAQKLQHDFQGSLDISFSAGADAFNISRLLACGLNPVTVCSDLLKPGGYGRLSQYISNLRTEFRAAKARSVKKFIAKKNANQNKNLAQAILENLDLYATKVLSSKAYKKQGFTDPSIKTARKLNTFDCIAAPCVETCPTNQHVPDYMYFAARGEWDKALEVVLQHNPFPSVTGMVCDHSCQSKCTRINYDSSLLIREIKRFIAESPAEITTPQLPKNGKQIAIIGAGPSGLSCAYYLAKLGFSVQVYESHNKAGGMVSNAIPSFRLTDNAIQKDVQRIENMGVKINFDTPVNKQLFETLRQENSYVYLAAGAQKARAFVIEGSDNQQVLNPLEFLYAVRNSEKTRAGKRIAIIGGGNTAMDTARTAKRLIGKAGKVQIIYRRTKAQMPADFEEVQAAMDEGIEILELVNPIKVLTTNGLLTGLRCEKMKLGKADSSGRARPEPIKNSEFDLKFDTIIPAVGQDLDLDFIPEKFLTKQAEIYKTRYANVYIGGDAFRGASTVIQAIADGRKVAESIAQAEKIEIQKLTLGKRNHSINDLRIKKAKRQNSTGFQEIAMENRMNFDVVNISLSQEEAMQEASRCLYCDELCDICVSVCPNRANYSYQTKPAEYQLITFKLQNNKIVDKKEKIFRITQKNQVLNIGDWCNECGNCTTFCPTAGQPFKDKPTLYLTKKSFETATEGYFIHYFEGEASLLYKNSRERYIVTEEKENYLFANDKYAIYFDKKTMEITDIKVFSDDVTADVPMLKAAEMTVILQAGKALYSEETDN